MTCRHCNAKLNNIFLDLGFAPPSNAYLTKNELIKPEKYYPLKIYVCNKCWLVQTKDFTTADDLFNSKYAYFSSTSKSWLEHAINYVEKMIKEFRLNENSFVIEVASNDGYLLKNFVAKRIPCLGIEPTKSTASVAEGLGIPVLHEFFDERLGKKLEAEGRKADLIIGNNVYAHVPDINNFTKGLKALLNKNGIITLEFPHLMRLIEFKQFDTVYHEHFSYLSLHTVVNIFRKEGLRVWYVEELTTHGGSLRIYGCHEDDIRITLPSVQTILDNEKLFGLLNISSYDGFQERINKIKNDFLEFLISQKKLRKKIAGYGAAAKGNTLLNYAGVKTDLLPFICDAAEAKQGMFMPGSHIPIHSPEKLYEEIYDYIIIFPWNISKEIVSQFENLKDTGVKFVTIVPELKFL